ncbi:MAG: SGNH/GDSL hydrolase family protein [Pseudoxanthomonas sp.]
MRQLLFWSCLPFVLPQALRLRRNAPRFSAPSCVRSGLVAGDRPVRLLGIGDSVIEGVGATTLDRALVGQTAKVLADALDAGVDWECVGSIGATSGRIIEKLLPRLPHAPADFIVVSAGVNDITSLNALATWRRSLSALLSALSQHSPNAVVGLVGIPPLQEFPSLPQPLRAVLGMRGRSFDRVAKQVVAPYPNVVHASLEYQTTRATFAADGFHPSEEAYAELAQTLASALLERFGGNAMAGKVRTQ